MTVQSIAFVAETWREVGGNPAYQVKMVAIAMAESGLDPDIVGPTDDWGLWQINGVHRHDSWGDWTYILEPDMNARFAIGISNNGVNVAPWAVCYANINATGWKGFMSDPEPGSAAASHLGQVAFALSGQAGPLPPPGTPPAAPPPPSPGPGAPPGPVPTLPPVNAPSGPGIEQVQIGWEQVSTWANLHAPNIQARIGSARQRARELLK